jgi:glycine cleavage system H protein
MKFTKDHEWVELKGDEAFVGISGYAAEQLGDVVFVEVPVAGQKLVKGESFAVVESVKAASDVYAPVSGEVLVGNPDLGNSPETINSVPEAGGWIAKIKLSDRSELDDLMDRVAYEAYLATL